MARPSQGNNFPQAKPAPRLTDYGRSVTVREQPGNVNPKITRGSMADATKPPQTVRVVQS